MFTDHQLRSRIDAHAQILEESIARMKAEEDDHGSSSGLNDQKNGEFDYTSSLTCLPLASYDS